MKIERCRGCLSEEIETVIDLGMQPWGNDFKRINSEETAVTYPLAVDFCNKCALLSLNCTVPKEVMFVDHTYLSGSTKTLSKHFKECALEGIQILSGGRQLQKRPKVLDIGSNDGTQLKYFQELGCDVLGVESAKNIAIIAQRNGIPTKVAFFNEDFAKSMGTQFDLISASGVFFHLEELHSAIKGIHKILLDEGIFVVQFIYLRDMVDNGAFDQIYHEHLVYYLFTTLSRLLEPHGLEIFDGVRAAIHGGSGIAYVSKKGQRNVSKRLLDLYAEEKDSGFLTIEKYRTFMADIENIKREAIAFIETQISQGKVIYGMGAPVKGNTLLNYFGFTTREIKCLVEINPMRKDKVAPGTNIPVILENELESQPDMYYCLAWNFRSEIKDRYLELENAGVEFHYPVITKDYKATSIPRVISDVSKVGMNKNDKILITGSSGLVGHALVKCLSENGFTNLWPLSSKDCNLIEKDKVQELFNKIKPDYVFHIAARTLGLGGNSKYQADILYQNVMMNTNVIESCRKESVKKIVAMGSGVVYPDLGAKELFEDQIWLGAPHNSQAGYAHSKRLMLAHLEATKEQYNIDYVFAVSGNIYGPHDLFNLDYGNVTPALIYKFMLAERDKVPVSIWGTGEAVRDFSHSSDIAKSLYVSMNSLSGPVNIGSGYRHKIKDIVEILSEIYQNKIEINFDASKPDGQMERHYNLDKLFAENFSPDFDLKSGVEKTHQWLLENLNKARF